MHSMFFEKRGRLKIGEGKGGTIPFTNNDYPYQKSSLLKKGKMCHMPSYSLVASV